MVPLKAVDWIPDDDMMMVDDNIISSDDISTLDNISSAKSTFAFQKVQDDKPSTDILIIDHSSSDSKVKAVGSIVSENPSPWLPRGTHNLWVCGPRALLKHYNRKGLTNGGKLRKAPIQGVEIKESSSETVPVWPLLLKGSLSILALSGIAYFGIGSYRDLKAKVHRAGELRRSEVATCKKFFTLNRCEPETRVPALQELCSQWEACILAGADIDNRAALFVQFIAQLFERFSEEVLYYRSLRSKTL